MPITIVNLSEAVAEPGKVNVKLRTVSMVQLKKIGIFCDGIPLVSALISCVRVATEIIDEFGQKFFGE
jgi:hypothetical protein